MNLVYLGQNRMVAVLAGVFTALGLLVIVGWLTYQIVQPGLRAHYYVLLPEVSGIRTGTEVHIAGYPAGEVVGMTPQLDGKELHFRLDLAVDRTWRVPVDSTVAVGQDSLLAAPVLDVDLGEADVLLPDGAQILAREGEPRLEDRIETMLREEVRPALAALRHTLTDIDEQVVTDLPAVVRDVRQVSRQVAEAVAILRPKTEKVAKAMERGADLLIAASSKDSRRQVQAMLGKVEKVMSNLEITSRELRTVIAASEKIVRGNEQALSSTLQDTAFTMQSLASGIHLILLNLERASQDLAGLVADIRANPSVLISGAGEKEKAPF